MNISFDSLPVAAMVFLLCIPLVIGYFANRYNHTEEDYLAAGRKLGFLPIMLSLFATWFGAETIISSAGLAAEEGLAGGRADPFGYTLCLLIFALMAFSLRGGTYITAGDFYKQRFGPVFEKVGALAIIPTSLLWAAAQIVAFAQVMSYAAGFDFHLSLVIATTVVVTYTMIGGMRGDIITDMLLSFFIIAGLLLTAIFAFRALGGVEEAFAHIDAEKLSFVSPGIRPWAQADEWAIAITGSLISQELFARIQAAKSPEVARKSTFAAAGLYLLAGSIPVMIGLAGAQLVPPGTPADNFLPELAKGILPAPVYALFLMALLAAILTTVDSTLLSVSALTGRNLIIPFFPQVYEDQSERVRLQRMLVVASGLFVYMIAISGESVYSLIEISSSFGSSGLLVCMVLGLWTRIGGALTAILTCLAGAVSAYIFQYVVELQAGYIASVGLSVVVYLLAAAAENRLPKRVVHA
ncbi:MAG: sodium:solute symporter [Alphaproteobacteria bacterium]|nr:sodium:solute symporter [Alphaproteobacteria bacterium]